MKVYRVQVPAVLCFDVRVKEEKDAVAVARGILAGIDPDWGVDAGVDWDGPAGGRFYPAWDAYATAKETTIAVEVVDGPYPDEDGCRTEGCENDPDNGEGWDGYCGDCADKKARA